MITCHRTHLLVRCRQRGYALDEVRACIVSEDGDRITVDVDHPAYPKKPKPGFVPDVSQKRLPPPGPGTELKALLKTIGIVAKPNCSCNKRAQIMDEKGCDWCDENIDEISGWLEEEAKKRHLPYVHAAGKMLIRLAIRRARAKKPAQTTSLAPVKPQNPPYSGGCMPHADNN